MIELKPWREYIGKHEAYMIMCDVLDVLYEKEAIKKTVYERLKQASSANKSGHWIDDGDCSICSKCHEAYGLTSLGQLYTPNFCPNCGADMKGSGESIWQQE